MSKRRATDATVMAFIEAVFPDAPQLALACFDEAHALRTATELIRKLRDDLRKATVKANGYRESAAAAEAERDASRERFREFATWVVMQVAPRDEALADAISAEASRIYNQAPMRSDVDDEIAFLSRSGPRNE